MKNYLIALFLLLNSTAVFAGEALDKRRNINIEADNDMISGTDKHFTHGTKITYVSGENDAPKWLLDTADKVPFFDDGGKTRYSFALGQNIYTPSDIKLNNPPLDDRPYAGWLYASAGLMSDAGNRLDNLEFTVGVVGPASQAGATQKWVHKNISDSPTPRGWHTQLKDELGLMVTYERMWRIMSPLEFAGFEADFMPHAGGSLGNVFTNVGAGGTFRFGLNLPSDYGPPRISPSLPGSSFFKPIDGFLLYGFAGFNGKCVGRNIFLDGNTFTDSRSVDKKLFVGDMQAGVVFGFKNIRLSYTKVFRTEEFEKQQNPDKFSSINVNFAF
ncbi:MAG: lipid A deacylase LpxR family protein [Alphaproteobacteria bacterium]